MSENILLPEENTKQYAERIIAEEMQGKLTEAQIIRVMNLVSSYGDIMHMKGKADGIMKAKAVYKPEFPATNTYSVLGQGQPASEFDVTNQIKP